MTSTEAPKRHVTVAPQFLKKGEEGLFPYAFPQVPLSATLYSSHRLQTQQHRVARWAEQFGLEI